MSVKRYLNDTSLEARPAFWIFEGNSASLFIVGLIFALLILKFLTWQGVDFWPSLGAAVLPLGLITLYVWFLVKDKPKSYCSDMLNQKNFGLRLWFFRVGITAQPPVYGGKVLRPLHPSALSSPVEENL